MSMKRYALSMSALEGRDVDCLYQMVRVFNMTYTCEGFRNMDSAPISWKNPEGTYCVGLLETLKMKSEAFKLGMSDVESDMWSMM